MEIIIIDKKILNLYKDCLKVLDDFNYIAIESNENQKSYEGLIPIIDSLINNGFKKNHRLIAIGGESLKMLHHLLHLLYTEELIGFFYPTSLLAQGDSCIEVKHQLILGNSKNQMGDFTHLKLYTYT